MNTYLELVHRDDYDVIYQTPWKTLVLGSFTTLREARLFIFKKSKEWDVEFYEEL